MYKGKGTSLALILILLITALILAWLAVDNMASIKKEKQENSVKVAQDAVDQMNQKTNEAGLESH